MLLTILQAAMVIVAQSQTWCGQPECGSKPKCEAAELDLIIAIDESCSMSASDWDKETRFATALANATEKKFNVSRFSGVVFGFTDPGNYVKPIDRFTSKIFHSMQPGAANFTASIPSDQGTVARGGSSPDYNCGGTPTDEALYWFYDELNRTRIPDRMQMAVLVTDGVPTLCKTAGGTCSGQTNPDAPPATTAAILERDNPLKLRSLGSLFMSVGIGGSLGTSISPTPYGSITGKGLLTRFASAPQMAFFPTDFNVLVNETLAQVLDMLCFYLIDVSPSKGCYSGGTMFAIRGYNFFSLGNPKCRWQEAGTSNYLYTNATVNMTNATIPGDPGFIGLVSCPAPMVPKDPYNAILEISRDGTYYTNNQYSLLLRNDCNGPRQCPNTTVAAVFLACNTSDFETQCSDACNNASVTLGQALDGSGRNVPAFTAEQIRDCISSNFPTTAPWTAAHKATFLARVGPGKGPCVVPPPSVTTDGAGTLSASLLLATIGLYM